jgi:hypothetical protein
MDNSTTAGSEGVPEGVELVLEDAEAVLSFGR